MTNGDYYKRFWHKASRNVNKESILSHADKGVIHSIYLTVNVNCSTKEI